MSLHTESDGISIQACEVHDPLMTTEFVELMIMLACDECYVEEAGS